MTRFDVVRMRTILTGFLSIILSISCTFSVYAQVVRRDDEKLSKTYVSFQYGANSIDKLSASVDFGGVNFDGEVQRKASSHLGVEIGYRWKNWVLGLEAQKGQFKLEQIQLGPFSQQIHQIAYYKSATAHVLTYLPLTRTMEIFAGVGVGAGSYVMPAMAFSNGCHCFASTSASKKTYQVKFGLEHHLTRSQSVFLQFAWLQLPGMKAETLPSVTYPRFNFSTAVLGYRWDF